MIDYFLHLVTLIKDYIYQGDVEAEYCPIEEMWDDVLNQPNQGKDFRELREELMNLCMNYDDHMEKLNTRDRISGVKTEGGKLSDPGTKTLFYRKAENE